MKRVVIFLAVLGAALSASAAPAAVFGWGNTAADYQKNEKPSALVTSPKGAFRYAAWKGEKVNAQAVIWSAEELKGLSLEVSELRSGKNVIPAGAVKAEFVGYVIGDVLDEGYNQCAARKKDEYPSMEAADLIGVAESVDIAAGCAQPVWVSVDVPSDAPAGTYKGTVTLRGAGVSLPYELKVLDRVLPAPSQWSFHLDLWQNPYAVARVAGVRPWSPEHFEAMRPVMKMLADAGQKVVTATIMNKPWNGQTEDPFGPMVTKVRRADGSWIYDYTIFDMWVEFMESVGISQQINCYTMIPWKLTFDYFDQATNSPAEITVEPGSAEYREYWGGFIADFARHLNEKGWFGKTYIAMDERPEEHMRAAVSVIRDAVPEFKIALAGNYHDSVADEIDDLCIGFRASFPEGKVAQRRAAGQISTYYTCCAEAYPNTFMASDRAESAWIPWGALALGVDGYLRWAYNSWTIEPEKDSRFRKWAAGDTYMVYPGARPSVRFALFLEGMQDVAKVEVLKKEWAGDSARAKSLAALEAAIASFTYETITEEGAAPALDRARKIINK